MKTEKLSVKVTWTEPVLGTASGNPQLHEEHIASKAPTFDQQKEEVAAVTPNDAADLKAQIEKTSTIFPADEKGLFIWDYQMRGYLKGALYALIELGDVKLSKWTYKRVVDLFVFVSPRRTYFKMPDGRIAQKTDTSTLQRPLRATTMQGDRIALARSEMLPPGVTAEFAITIMLGQGKATHKDLSMEQIIACLNYGEFVGYSQWRGGGFGRFSWEEKKS